MEKKQQATKQLTREFKNLLSHLSVSARVLELTKKFATDPEIIIDWDEVNEILKDDSKVKGYNLFEDLKTVDDLETVIQMPLLQNTLSLLLEKKSVKSVERYSISGRIIWTGLNLKDCQFQKLARTVVMQKIQISNRQKMYQRSNMKEKKRKNLLQFQEQLLAIFLEPKVNLLTKEGSKC